MNGTKINASKYTPQLPHWSQDLSKWNNSASVMQALNSDSDKLKHNETLLFVNDDYCEISRRRPNARYHHLLFQVLTDLMALSVLSFVIFFLCTIDIGEIIKGYTDSDRKGRGILVLALVTFIALLIISLTAFNYFLFAPKDYPLRFNRKTGKVYVYDYVNLHVWHLAETLTALFKFPFFLPTRPVEKVFDWQDIQAVETYYMTSIKGVNKTTRSIYCVVCAPGTTQIVDRFMLSITGDGLSATPYRQWVWVCSYMSFNDTQLDNTLVNRDNFWGRPVVWSDKFAKESARSK